MPPFLAQPDRDVIRCFRFQFSNSQVLDPDSGISDADFAECSRCLAEANGEGWKVSGKDQGMRYGKQQVEESACPVTNVGLVSQAATVIL